MLGGNLRQSGLQEGPQEASVPGYLSSQAIPTIERYAADSRPFFVSANYWGPHRPYWITDPHYSMYDTAAIKPWPNFFDDISDQPGMIRSFERFHKTHWITPEKLSRIIGKYYGYVSLIDDEIGRILDTLEAAGELDSTLIVYSSDHGSSVGARRSVDKGYGMYDDLTRIPLIVSHPSITPSVSDAYVTLLDLAPTFLDLAGAPVPDSYQGSSLMPIITGDRDAVRDDFIVTESFGLHLAYWQRMVRTDTTKYIYNATGDDEFYDLARDPWEMTNIIGDVDRTVLSEHRDRMLGWMRETGDPLRSFAGRELG